MLVTPPDHCKQRLLARQGRRLSTREQSETLAQTAVDFLHGEHVHARSREFDCKRNSVEATTDFRDCAGSGRIDGKSSIHTARTLNKQTDRLTGLHGVQIAFQPGSWGPKRSHRHDSLAGHVQALPARGEYSQMRRCFQQSVDQVRAGVRQLLAVIQKQQRVPRAESPAKRIEDGRIQFVAHLQCLGNTERQALGVGHRREIHKPDAVRI